jgi:type VI secretion system secreted protein Hcp
MIDGFLELLRGGKPAVHGENLDASFAAKHAMAIQSFTLSSDSKAARAMRGMFEDDEMEGDEDAALAMMASRKSRSKTGGEKQRPFTLNFEVTKAIDSASPALFKAYCARACVMAKPYDVARVTLRKAGGAKPLEYVQLQFTQVFVATYDVDSNSGDQQPTETVTFTFRTCSILYRPQKSAGSAPARQTAWNFENPATG